MVYIDSDMPLPEHTKLDYDECYAKVLIENLFFDCCGNVELSDKPDLVNIQDSIGIEVTTATTEGRKEAEKLWYTMPYQDKSHKAKNIERMRQLGIEYQPIQTWPVRTYTSDIMNSPARCVVDSFEKKVKKLNSGNYQYFRMYHLFILSDIHLSMDTEKLMLNILADKNIKTIKFECVFLLTNEDIYKFNLISLTINRITYEEYHEKQYNWAMQARKMVEEGELNDQT